MSGYPILVELIDLMNSIIIFLSRTTLLSCYTAFPTLENSHHVVATVSVDFPSKSKMGKNHIGALFIVQVMTILDRIRIALVIMWEMFHVSITSRLVLQQLLLNFVVKCRLQLLYIHIYQVVSMRSSFIHLHGFQPLSLLSQLISYVYTKIINLLHLK